ncbi:hypothetical protein CLOM_g18446 [Closterium sp. NIES-68]|nr:hypothetical protein CLOM_g18446 [Closterium sp. NIES-68]
MTSPSKSRAPDTTSSEDARLLSPMIKSPDSSRPARKRSRDDLEEAGFSKAQREKMRRDRLNDRFLELGRELDPTTTPRTDKGIILNNAVRVLTGLKAEAAALKQGTWQLQEQIKELKAEKSELRDEKARLKAQRECLQLQLQALPLPTPDRFSSPAAAAAAAAAALAALQAAASGPISSHFTVKPQASVPADAAHAPGSVWQWLQSASGDVARDQVLRAPVA